MGLLDEGLPCTVEVSGSEVPIRTGFRRGVRASMLDRRDPDDRLVALALFYGEPEEWPEQVLADMSGAIGAGFEWLDGAWRSCTYGSGGRSGARTFDLEADAPIVAADFQRLYGIDLLDDSTRVHWWRFVALLSGAMRTEGSLTSQAVGARSPMPEGIGPTERKRLKRIRESWKLPPNEEELREIARAEFGG